MKILAHLGYDPVTLSGRTRGSRRKFYNPQSGHVVFADEPHDGEMKPGMVTRLRKALEEAGAI